MKIKNKEVRLRQKEIERNREGHVERKRKIVGGTQIETGKEEYCGGKVAMDELNVPCIFLYVRTL